MKKFLAGLKKIKEQIKCEAPTKQSIFSEKPNKIKLKRMISFLIQG